MSNRLEDNHLKFALAEGFRVNTLEVGYQHKTMTPINLILGTNQSSCLLSIPTSSTHLARVWTLFLFHLEIAFRLDPLLRVDCSKRIGVARKLNGDILITGHWNRRRGNSCVWGLAHSLNSSGLKCKRCAAVCVMSGKMKTAPLWTIQQKDSQWIRQDQ